MHRNPLYYSDTQMNSTSKKQKENKIFTWALETTKTLSFNFAKHDKPHFLLGKFFYI